MLPRRRLYTLFAKPHEVLKFLLYLKNISQLDMVQKINCPKNRDKTMLSKRLQSKCKTLNKRWFFMCSTIYQEYSHLLRIFKTKWSLAHQSLGTQKLEIKIKSNRDKSPEQQFNELPAILLLINKTFEFINTKNYGLQKFDQELFVKNKTLKLWVRRYRSITYLCKTVFYGNSFIMNFLVAVGKLLPKFPKLFLRKTKLFNHKKLTFSILNFWTWSLLDNLQVNPNNLGLKNIFIEPINLSINIQTKHKQNTAWYLLLFLWSVSFPIYLCRKKSLLLRHIFNWHTIKSKMLIFPTKLASVFSKKIKQIKIKKKRRILYLKTLKKYLTVTSLFERYTNSKLVSLHYHWNFFKRLRLVVNLSKKL